MPQSETKVIGVFAYRSRTDVVCTDVDACVIAGSEEAMRQHIAEMGGPNAHGLTIRKTRFGEIVQGLLAGGAYAFDHEAYSRFLPLARDLGLPVLEPEFPSDWSNERRFLTVRFVEDARK